LSDFFLPPTGGTGSETLASKEPAKSLAAAERRRLLRRILVGCAVIGLGLLFWLLLDKR
jgi:hypothetical protein